MLADNTHATPSATAPFEGDSIEGELAFLQDLLAQAAGESGAIDRAELAELPWLSDELPLNAPRDRYRPAGPTLVKVAAMGLATFPAAIAPVPAFANEPLPQNMMLAFAQRPESAPALGATGAQLFPFSRPMMSMRAQVAPTQAETKNQKLASAKPFQLNPKLKTLFSESRKVAVTTKAGAASTFYQVGKGDSLYSIAADLLGSGGRWREIANANKATLSANYMLKPGQRLVIPTNRTVTPVHLAAAPKAMPHNSPSVAAHAKGMYRVASGDSLYKIAQKRLGSGERWREIVAMNKATLQGKTVIYPNQWLMLPNHLG
jgi:nucleoid-associated protein YgaU